METRILGIIDNTMYLAPIYGGDNYHTVQVDDITKNTYVEYGDVPVFDSIDHIECQLHGWSVEKYRYIVDRHQKVGYLEATTRHGLTYLQALSDEQLNKLCKKYKYEKPQSQRC